MKIDYYKWWSPSLGQEMELKAYGYYGKPMLVFPAQGSRFYEFEDRGMNTACAEFIESGRIKVYTVDSVDTQSWANLGIHLADRARRHQDYDRYIADEVVPFIRQDCGDSTDKFITTGVSMGGYHSAPTPFFTTLRFSIR